MATVVERETRAKLHKKEYADRTQGAKHSDIEEGDKVLLKETCENKLAPNYEPEPYIVTRKDGNAAILQDTNGNNKMRNIAHMKKFVDPGNVDKGEVDLQPHLAEQPVQPEQDKPNLSPSQPAADTPEAPSSPLPAVSLRPVRARAPPAWMRDFTCAAFKVIQKKIRDSELSFEHFISPFEFVISTFVDLLVSFCNSGAPAARRAAKRSPKLIWETKGNP